MSYIELDWIKSRANLKPQKIALRNGETGESWTYSELNNRANNLANYLLKLGIKKGDRVAYYSPNRVSHFEMFFASTKIGAIFLPLNWRLKTEELETIFADSAPSFLLYDSHHVGRIRTFLKNVENLECDSEKYNNIVSAQEEIEINTEKLLKEDTALILYTGGSTGIPKGVEISHKSLIFNALSAIVTWDITSKDSTLAVAPMYHIAGFFGLVIPILVAGGEVTLQKYYEPATTYGIVKKYGITSLFMVPTMYYDLLDQKDIDLGELTSLKTLLSGGAPPSQYVFENYSKHGHIIVNAYGMTESGPNNFRIMPEDALERPNSIGVPAPFVQVKLIDHDGNEVEQGEPGELCISGEHQFSKYWKNEEATSETLIDGYIHTGDIAYQDEDGFYYILNREKEMIITGGENVYPSEVENVLYSHPLVKEAVVVGYRNERWGESVVAAIVLEEADSNYDEILTEYCNRKIAGYKRPKLFVAFDDFPVNSVGKTDRKEIQEIIESTAVLV